MKKLVRRVVPLILIVFIVGGCSHKGTNKPKDTYKNYKECKTSFGLSYKIPKSWESETLNATDTTYTKEGTSAEDGMVGVYYYEYDGDITQKNNFPSLVKNIKEMENYSGSFISKSSTVNTINLKRYSYNMTIENEEYIVNGAVFKCGNGYSIMSIISPSSTSNEDIFNNIIDSISIDNSITVTATEEQTETTTESITEDTTTETSSATESTTKAPKTTKQIKKEYIDKCKIYDYKKIKRNESKYYGKKMAVRVRISQVLEDSGTTWYRAYQIIDGDWDISKEYTIIDDRSSQTPKILEDDVISVYGEYTGLNKVTRALGETTDEVPAINMKYMKLRSE